MDWIEIDTTNHLLRIKRQGFNCIKGHQDYWQEQLWTIELTINLTAFLEAHKFLENKRFTKGVTFYPEYFKVYDHEKKEVDCIDFLTVEYTDNDYLWIVLENEDIIFDAGVHDVMDRVMSKSKKTEETFFQN